MRLTLLTLLSIWAISVGASNCARYNPSELEIVCVRYVDDAGYLRGRTLHFNTQGARDALRDDFSHAGPCVDGVQGEPELTEVCFTGVSLCGHDRTLELFEDVARRYVARGRATPGRCQVYVEDDCLLLGNFLRPDPCLQYDSHCEDLFTNPKLGPGEVPLLPPEPPPGTEVPEK